MPLIIPANSITGGYEVDNSLRFNDGSSDYLNRTPGSASNRKTWTFSAWIKRSTISTGQRIFSQGDHTSGDPMTFLAFKSDDTLQFNRYVSGATELVTNRKFRDVSAWYHIVFRCDTTNGTAGDRFRLYINGVEETSFATDNNPSLNADTEVNNTQKLELGSVGATTQNFDGYMAEVVLIDGQQLDPTSFGEFDEDTGIWKPKAVSGLTFGTNGFYLDFENSGSLGADVSGNGNNFTVNNLTSIDQTTDTCTNNFATFNPLFPTAGTSVFSEGNLKLVASGSAGSGLSSFGVSKGKWYMEVKQTAVNEPLGNGESGICVVGDPTGNLGNVQGTAFAYGIRNNTGTKFENTSSTSTWHGNWTAGDIISIALDMDNNRVYFAKNGQYADGSGNWNQSFIGSPAYLSLSTAKTDYFLAMSQLHATATETYESNFGSPSFSISSGNSDGNSIGNFEYEVPDGYFALCTSNLAEHG
jgi:hypothetical protein